MPIATHIHHPDGPPGRGLGGGEECGEEERGEEEMGEVVCLPLGFPSILRFLVRMAHYPRIINQNMKPYLFPIAHQLPPPLPSPHHLFIEKIRYVLQENLHDSLDG